MCNITNLKSIRNMNEYIFCYPPLILVGEAGKNIKILKPINAINLYIHIPFCTTECYYCGYAKTTRLNLKDKYLKYLIKEIDLYRSIFQIDKIPVKTVALGGGTPTILNVKELEGFISEIYKRIVFVNEPFFSIESTPNLLTENKVKFLKELGFNRLSIGIETFNKNVNEFINRKNDTNTIQKIEYGKKYFDNLNLDFIIGLPKQDFKSIINDILILGKIDPPAISFYRYYQHPYSYFWSITLENKLKIPNKKMVDVWINQFINSFIEKRYKLTKVYYLQKENIDDLHYGNKWRNENILGLGISGHSYIEGHVFFNYNYRSTGSSLTSYFNNLDNGELPIFKHTNLSNEETKQRYMVLGIKNKEISFDDYFSIFKTQLISDFNGQLNNLQLKDYIILENDKIRLTRKGIINWPEVSYNFYSANVIKNINALENNRLKYGSRFN